MRWWLVLAMGCSTAEAPRAVQSDALASVNGQAIAPAEVQALVRATGVSPREALQDLVSERLLAAHAARYASAPEVQRGVERALVQRLLALEVGDGDPDTQRARLERLLAKLSAETRVQYQEATISRVFAP